MDYEKKYKEANDKVAARFGDNVAREIFSDLYESEDEKIRKALINGFKRYDYEALFNGCLVREILPWLEKQGQKSAWTEEDEERFQSCLYILQAKGFMGVAETINTKWIKSLKQRYAWKPTSAQMKALDSAIDEFDGYKESGSLVSLKKDLEKLKRE